MLHITRKINESIMINDDCMITVSDIGGGQVKLTFNASDDYDIWRSELYLGRNINERK